MRELLHLSNYSFIFFVVTNDIEEILGDGGGRFEYVYAPKWTGCLLSRFFWQHFFMPGFVKRLGCNLIYSASGYPEIFTSLPIITHQQNLWSFVKPDKWWSLRDRVQSFFRRLMAKIAIYSADANVFISNHMRKMANAMLVKQAGKNFTVYNAISPANLIEIQPVETDWSKDDFCLAVGSVIKHKNYVFLLRAFKKVVKQYPELKLVIVGNYNNKYGSDLVQFCKDSGLETAVVFTGIMDIAEIFDLYRKAQFSVNVSLLEGFGLPVLESIAAGCPVICSDCEAFHEIGDSAVIYCAPENVDDIAEKMISLYADQDQLEWLKRLGLERSKEFSWQESAKELLRLFKMVLDN